MKIPTILATIVIGAVLVIAPIRALASNWIGYAVTLTTATPIPTPVVGVMRSNDFLNTLGVTSHIVQQRMTPVQWQVAFPYLGVRLDRDDFTCDGCDPNNWNANFFIPMHTKFGVKWVGMAYAAGSDPTGSDIGTTLGVWDQLGKAGALAAVEGPNEPNNQPFNYKGVDCNQGTTFQGCANYQTDLYNAVKADSNLTGLPVWSETEVGAESDNVGLQFISGFADAANLHNYVVGNDRQIVDNKAWASEAPDAAECCAFDGMDGEFLRSTWGKKFPASPLGSGSSIPKVTTETGWDDTTGPISADMKGKILTSVYLDGAARGWLDTFIYQMLDDVDTFGIFTNASPPVPKLSATYIHNLTSIIADTSSAFTPTPISYSVQNNPVTGHSLLLQKSNGTYALAVWGEAFASETPTAVTVNLGATYANVSVFDITVGTTAINAYSLVNSIPLTLTDHPFIIEFSN
jgi:hypothetical protein